MNLLAVASEAEISVLRDGVFENLGFITQPQPKVLVFLENVRFLRALLKNRDVAAVVTTAELAESIPAKLAVGVSAQPRLAFARIHNFLAHSGFYWERFPTRIDPDARVHPTAFVADWNVSIGPRTTIAPRAVVLERCLIGADVQVGAACVLGGVGFQTVRTDQLMVELEHAGGLSVGDSVRILPGAVVATGLFRHNTTIARDVRVGSQSFISHGVSIGERAFVGHGSVVNGNVTIGSDAWIGPGAVVSQELEIGDGAFVSLGAAVIRSVKAGRRVSGNFAISHRRLLRTMADAGREDLAEAGLE